MRHDLVRHRGKVSRCVLHDFPDEPAGGRLCDRGDPLKTKIDQRQADDEHDRDKQRDDGGLEPELNASIFIFRSRLIGSSGSTCGLHRPA
jgi:hypothetical protein